MPLRTPDTSEEQDTAHNRSQAYYDRKFNDLTKGLSDDENQAGSQYNDTLDDHPVTAGDASGESGDLSGGSRNTDDVKDREENPNGNPMNSSFTGDKGGKQPLDLKTRIAKKGPLGALILTLAGAGIGISTFLSPGLIFVQIADIFTNHNNVGNAAVSIRTKAVLGNKIGNAFANPGDAKCGIKCKFATMDNTLFKKLEANKFTVESTKVGNRHIVKSITFPDKKTKITSLAEFNKVMDNPIHAAALAKVHDAKSKPFLTSKFSTTIRKYGIDKVHKLIGSSKEKFNSSLRKAIGLPEVPIEIDGTKTQTDAEKLDASPRLKKVSAGVGKLGGGISGGIGAICTAHNVTRLIASEEKLAKAAAYAKIAMVLLNASSKLKAADSGGIDPGVATLLGNILTEKDTRTKNPDGTPNDGLGLTATDSYSYKVAAHGDTGKPPNYVKQFSLEPKNAKEKGFFDILANVTLFSASTPQARAVANPVCKAGTSDLASFASCAPTAVTVVGYGICVATDIAAGFAIGKIVEFALPLIIKEVISSSLMTLDENSRGPSFMEPVAIGSAEILNASGANYALAPGTTSQLSDYFKLSQEVNIKDEAIARVQAKDTPLDIYNQYSFLGSMAKSLNLAAYANAPLTANVRTLAATIPQSLSSLTLNTNAGTYMPVADSKLAQYQNDNCPALQSIGAKGDTSCVVGLSADVGELKADVFETIDHMSAPTDGALNDDTGAVRTDTTMGKQFQLYIDNCLNRKDEWGETSRSIEDGEPGDYEWFLGAKCSEQSPMVRDFRIYARDELINASAEDEASTLKTSEELNPSSSSTTQPTGANSTNINPDGWTFPTTAGSTLSSPFGPRGGGYHTGVDLNVPSGSPFYATRDGVVRLREYDIYSIPGDDGVGGSWCPVTPSESRMQKDIWISHTVDGTPYTSIYAHLSQYAVQDGATVKAGDLIGYTGGSGCSDGPHVHFEIWQSATPTPSKQAPGVLDPWPLINK